MIKHRTKLLGVALEVGVGELESGEISDFGDFIASETDGHGGAS